MILWRYFCKEFLKNIFFLTTFFLSMYVLIDFLELNSRYFPKYNARPMVIAEYYAVQIPKMIVDILPFCCLFASIITFWIFARSGEIASIRAAGCSIFRVSLPILSMGALFSVASFLISAFVVPPAIRQKMRVENIKIERQKLAEIYLESRWVKGNANILHFRKFNAQTNALEFPELYELNPNGSIAAFVTGAGAIFDKETWVIQNPKVTRFNLDALGRTTVSVQAIASYKTKVHSQPPKILRDDVNPDEIGFFALRSLISANKKVGGEVVSRDVDLHQKIALPFANLIFCSFGMLFAVRKERQADTYLGIIFCLAAAIIYWVGNGAMRGFAKNGYLPPLLAAWFMTLLLATIGIVVIKRLDRA